jgi:hypothetical protein
MYNRNRSPYIRTVLITLLVLVAFIIDVIFSTSRFPVFTSIVCGIVVIYEFVSPFIYSAR